MKTLELDLKKKVLIIDLPIDAKNIYMSGNSVIFNINKSCITNPLNGNYEFLCNGSDLTEEITSELVEKDENGDFKDIKFKDYTYEFSKEAFIANVEISGFYWLENPVKIHTLASENADEYRKKWQKVEEKTFKNPLIFVKK